MKRKGNDTNTREAAAEKSWIMGNNSMQLFMSFMLLLSWIWIPALRAGEVSEPVSEGDEK